MSPERREISGKPALDIRIKNERLSDQTVKVVVKRKLRKEEMVNEQIIYQSDAGGSGGEWSYHIEGSGIYLWVVTIIDPIMGANVDPVGANETLIANGRAVVFPLHSVRKDVIIPYIDEPITPPSKPGPGPGL